MAAIPPAVPAIHPTAADIFPVAAAILPTTAVLPPLSATPNPPTALAAPSSNAHPMATRSKLGILIKPNGRLNLYASHSAIFPIPTSYRSTLLDPNWLQGMRDEYTALMQNNTWSLVPPSPGVNIVSSKWILHHKFHSDGCLARYKARWVVCGYS